MLTLLYALGVLAGLALLIFGANQLVDGAAGFARKVGVSPQLIGVTLVAVATSLPELFTSITATISGNYGIALGNVVGSNTFNIGMVLGLSLLLLGIKPSTMAGMDAFVMIASSILLGLFLIDLRLGRLESAILFTGYMVYTIMLVRRSKETFVYSSPAPKRSRTYLVILIVLGVICLIGGAPLLVSSSSGLARVLGIEQTIIGSTLIAAGTSFPELFTSIIAAIKKEGDIALGNVVGSNIFNTLLILGVSGLITPLRSNELLSVSLVPGMILLSLLGMVISMRKMGKLQGSLLLFGYIIWSLLMLV